MYRTFPALIALTLAACSSSGGGTSTTTTGSGSGPGGSVTGTTGAKLTSSGSTTGNGATGGSSTGAVQGTTGGASGGTVTVNNFNALFNDGACQFISNCSSGAPDAPYLLNALCPTYELADFSGLPQAVDAGRIAFNASQAQQCIAGLTSGSCSTITIFPCLPFLDGSDGLLPPAGPCYSGADCLSGSCVGNVTSTCTAGTCSGLVASGGNCDCTNCGACNPDAGLTCDTTSDTCAPEGQVGQACGNGISCAPTLACVNNVCTSYPVSAGNACGARSGACASGLYCFEKQGKNYGNCATLVAAGQPCGEDVDHQANAFAGTDNECAGAHPVCLGAGTLTDGGVAVGTCSEYSDIGGPCTPPSDAIEPGPSYNDGCYGGLNCVSGACVKPPSAGAACATQGIPCDEATSYCASATSTCKTFIGLGGTCTGVDNNECGLSANCNTSNNVCEGNTPGCSPTL